MKVSTKQRDEPEFTVPFSFIEGEGALGKISGFATCEEEQACPPSFVSMILLTEQQVKEKLFKKKILPFSIKVKS